NFFKFSINKLTAASWSGIEVFLIYSLSSFNFILKTALSIPTRSAIPEAITFSSGNEKSLYLNDELPEFIAKTFFIIVTSIHILSLNKLPLVSSIALSLIIGNNFKGSKKAPLRYQTYPLFFDLSS